MSRQSLAQQEKQEAIDYLRTILEPGDTVYTILRHVSRSGMMRVIGAIQMTEDSPNDITPRAAKALGEPLDRDRWGVKVGGCGMDMGFHLVYNLSYTLFPDSFYCIGENCPSNDHTNLYLIPAPEGTCLDHVERKTGVCRKKDCKPWKHSDGGYALRHRWL